MLLCPPCRASYGIDIGKSFAILPQKLKEAGLQATRALMARIYPNVKGLVEQARNQALSSAAQPPAGREEIEVLEMLGAGSVSPLNHAPPPEY